MQEFICQNLLWREVIYCVERFIKTLIELKNIVAELVFNEVENFFISDARTNFKSIFSNKKSIRNIFFIVERVICKFFFRKIRHSFKQIQRCFYKIKNFFHFKNSFQLKRRRKIFLTACYFQFVGEK